LFFLIVKSRLTLGQKRTRFSFAERYCRWTEGNLRCAIWIDKTRVHHIEMAGDI
jgi:hypothetical protein